MLEAIDLAGKVGDLTYVDLNFPFFGGDDIDNEAVGSALERNDLKVIGITPEIYTRVFAKGAFTNPDAGVRRLAHELCIEAAGVVRHFGAQYVKLWPGQDGWDYPFQVDHGTLWQHSMDGVGQLAAENPDLRFVIEYKPREPRVKMSFDSVARTLLGIEKLGLPNVGILLDFGHSLYGGESPADAAQLAIDYGRLFGMDVNDNFRGWDDDLVAGSVHPIELFEFFYTLRKNDWEGVWQLDQFPFREDNVDAARTAIEFLKAVHRALDKLDVEALEAAQANHDAMTALRIVQAALFSSMYVAGVAIGCGVVPPVNGARRPGPRPSVERLSLITKVAGLYHEQGVRQPDIAATLHISQARVSRLLKEAVALRIVRTLVVPPPGVHGELEEVVREAYRLEDVIVADADDPDEVVAAIGAAGSLFPRDLTGQWRPSGDLVVVVDAARGRRLDGAARRALGRRDRSSAGRRRQPERAGEGDAPRRAARTPHRCHAHTVPGAGDRRHRVRPPGADSTTRTSPPSPTPGSS